MVSFTSYISSSSIFKPKKELLHLFWTGVSRRVAYTFLVLFSSVYVYEVFIEQGFQQKNAIFLAILFHVILRLAKLISLVFAEDLSQKVGFLPTLRLSVVPFLIFIYVLVKASNYPWLFFLAAALWGIHAGLYWWGFHGYFLKVGDQDHYGQELGEVQFLRTTAAVVTPFVGGLIISNFGFSSVFYLSGVFMVLAAMFLKNIKNTGQVHDVNFVEVLKLAKKHINITLVYAAAAAEEVFYTVFWPVFLYLVFGDVLSLGGIVSLATLLVALTGIVIGDWVDKQGERQVLLLSIPVLFVSWIVRIFARGFGIYVLADTGRNFGQKITNLTLTELTYKKASKRLSARALLFREIGLVFGAVAALLVTAMVILLGGRLDHTFMVAAAVTTIPLIAILRKDI